MYYGNTENTSPAVTRTATAATAAVKRTRLSNLIPNAANRRTSKSPSSRAEKENVAPHFRSSLRPKRKKEAHDTYEAYSPAKRPKRSPATTISVSVQTDKVIDHTVVAHDDLLNLQQRYGFSNNQMRGIVSTFRQATHVARLIEPNYEQFLTHLPKLLEDIYAVTDYHPPANADLVPVVYCTDTSELLHRLQTLHHRDIKIVHNSVDSGM